MNKCRSGFSYTRTRAYQIPSRLATRESEHPHGLPDAEFDAPFTPDRPVVFAYHGYPWLIHRLTHHDNLHVRGYKEEGGRRRRRRRRST